MSEKNYHVYFIYGISVNEKKVWEIYDKLRRNYFYKLSAVSQNDNIDDFHIIESCYLNRDKIYDIYPEKVGNAISKFILRDYYNCYNNCYPSISCFYQEKSKEFLFYIPTSTILNENMIIDECESLLTINNHILNLEKLEIQFSKEIEHIFGENNNFEWKILLTDEFL